MPSSLRYLHRLRAVRHAVSVLAVALPLAAPASYAQTLAGAMVHAYRTNPELRAQRARLAASQAGLSQARAGWRPSIRLSGGVGSEHVDTLLAPTMGGADIKRTLAPRSIGLAVDQSLYDGGGTSAAVNAATNTIRATTAGLRQTEQTVFLSVITAYLDVRLDQSVLSLQQHNVQTLRQQLKATRLRERAGELTPTDVYQAKARLAEAVAHQSGAQATLAESRAAYQRAVGVAPTELAPPGLLPALPGSLASALATARHASPLLARARYASAAAQDDIRKARARGGLSVNLVGEIRHDNDGSIFTARTDTQRIMLNAAVPLYTGGADSARTRRAEENAAASLADLDAQRQQVTESVTAAWQAWQATHAELTAFAQQRRAAESALAGVRAEERAGSRTVLDVLNAQQELLNSQVSEASARHDRRLAAYRLLAATGQLTPTALDLPVSAVQ